jgi:hypothetical protein
MIAIVSPTTDFNLTPGHDRQVHAAAAAALATSKYAPLRQLDCQVSEGVVKISGTVPSFYLKALAQAAVLHLYPDSAVENLVEVTGETNVLVATNCGGPKLADDR